jgi:Autophagy-related protein C terminal domain
MWKQQLYAFLLRRVLGPILTAESNRKLHSVIDISLQEGRFVISDVELNPALLESSGFHVQSTTVKKIEIQLSLQEDGPGGPSASSLAWRAFQLTGNSASVALIANVWIDGLEIRLLAAPLRSRKVGDEAIENRETPSPSSTRAFLSSYVDAAVSSMRLTVKMTNTRVRVEHEDSWLECCMKQVHYEDRVLDSEAIFHKHLAVVNVSATTGSNQDASSPLALFEGTTDAQWRLLSTHADTYDELESLNSVAGSESEPLLHHDVRVSMKQTMHLSVHKESLLRVLSIVQCFCEASCVDEDEITGEALAASNQSCIICDDVTEHDFDVIDGLMKQYQTARLLAERKEIRGGILVPCINPSGSDRLTFDTFFDANEFNASKYSSYLKESLCLGSEANKSAPDDWVHASFQVHLDHGNCKLSFSSDRTQGEYILLSFSDMEIQAACMREQAGYSVRLHHFEIEDTCCTDVADCRNEEIGCLLRFSPHETSPQSDEPCFAMTVKVSHQSSLTSQIDAEVTFAALEVALHVPTVFRCAKLLQDVSERRHDAMDTSSDSVIVTEESAPAMAVALYVKFERIDVLFPLTEEKDRWNVLYERCGYSLESSISSRRPALGLTLDQLLIDCAMGKNDLDHETTITLRNAIVFASSPTGQHSFDTWCLRTEICSFCGRMEVEPCIPISIRIVSQKRGCLSDQHSARIFPKVVDISSFKARQAEDNEAEASLTGNPEEEMTKSAALSSQAVFVFVPEVLLDLSSVEVRVVQEMTESMRLSNQTGEAVPPALDNVASSAEKRPTSILIDFDSISALLRESNTDESFAFFVATNRLKCHVLQQSNVVIQSRLILQSFTLCEGTIDHNITGTHAAKRQFRDAVVDRLMNVRKRMSRDAGVVLTPIFHRSHLFEPLSTQTPALLVDFVSENPSDSDELLNRMLFVTLYDTTYRLDYESQWLDKLQSLFSKSFVQEGEEDADKRRSYNSRKVLTKTFCSIVDFNIDYTPSHRFPTASRLVVRIGDFRVSGNVVAPMQGVQVVKFSLGDISVFLCGERFPYGFENLCIGKSLGVVIDYLSAGFDDSMSAKTVFQMMNTKTVATLDSLEGSAALNQRELDGPPVLVHLNVGELCFFACKDSFGCLVGTLSELSAEVMAVTTEGLNDLRSKSTHPQTEPSKRRGDADHRTIEALDNLRERSALRPAFGCPVVDQTTNHSGFLLDGYDWTTIDSDETGFAPTIPSDEEQAARWYSDAHEGVLESVFISSDIREDAAISGPRIVTDHFALDAGANPAEDGDMGVAKYVGDSVTAKIAKRIILQDLSLRLRLFDGYDWPKPVHRQSRYDVSKRDFVIPETADEELCDTNAGIDMASATKVGDRKSELMDGLLALNDTTPSTFCNHLLPEERARQIEEQVYLQHLARRTNSYVELSASGILVRVDSLVESTEHRLASCLHLKVRDFFLAETISSKRPFKMVGEWFNEDEHPRDTNDGLLTMKVRMTKVPMPAAHGSLQMTTWHPELRVNLANEIASDECEAMLHLLPLRCLLDQRAIAFARAFFRDDHPGAKRKLRKGLHPVPPPLFNVFRVLPLKLKVDYWPQKLNPKALRDGAIIELINLSPLDGMVLILQQVDISKEVGLGAVMSILVGCWVKDICSTQLLQFIIKARPLEPITQLSGAATDMIVLPWEAFQNGESIQKALRSGIKGLSKTIAYELLTISSKTAQFLAGNASRMSMPPSAAGDFLPSRPMNVPRGVLDTAPHAFESINRGIQAANHRIIIVPYREFHRIGTTGAVKSVIRGIPVALAAPASGAAEALSFALIGVRNQVRPDIRREEEVSAKGLDR